MRIAVAGSSGFLGSHLLGALRAGGHDVLRLVRREPRGADEVRWDPAAGTLDPAVLSTVDAVVNMAGANVGRRWTRAYKRRIRDSRLDTTATLARALVAADPRPATWLNASAVGFYGDTGERAVDEQAPPGTGFLPELCQEWEAATRPAEDAGVRVVRMRTGLPLHRDGGLLKPILLPFRLGLGGRLADGRHYWPWISMADWLGAVRFLLERADLAGPVNLTGPAPVTNAEFTRALGAVLHRPTLLPVPRPALRLALGEFAVEPLASLRVLPGVLTRTGYAFQDGDVTAALRGALA
jgi:uncharacterized protein (TIGR01777 family)